MLGVALAVQLGSSAVHQGLPALAPLIQAEWSLSRAEFGVLAGAYNVGMLLTSLAAGQLVDRVGERPLIVAGPLGVAGATLLAALSPAPQPLWLSLVLAGCFLSTCGPSGGKAVLLWFPRHIRGLAMGLRQTGVPLAGVIAAPTLPLLAAALGWRGALGTMAVLSATVAAVAWLLYRDPPSREAAPAHHRTGLRAVPEMTRDRSLMATTALGPILVAGQWTLLPYLGLYLYERLGWPLEVAAGYLALAQAGGFVGRIGWGAVSDLLWHGRRKPALALVCPVGAGCAVALATLPVDAPAVLVGLVAVVMGAAVIGWNGLFGAYVAEQAGAHRAGTALGLATTVVFLGAVVCPPLFGWIVDRAGSYQPAWLLLAGLLVAGLGLFPFMREAPRS